MNRVGFKVQLTIPNYTLPFCKFPCVKKAIDIQQRETHSFQRSFDVYLYHMRTVSRSEMKKISVYTDRSNKNGILTNKSY